MQTNKQTYGQNNRHHEANGRLSQLLDMHA